MNTVYMLVLIVNFTVLSPQHGEIQVSGLIQNGKYDTREKCRIHGKESSTNEHVLDFYCLKVTE